MKQLITGLAVLSMAFAMMAISSAGAANLSVEPWAYDPDNTGTAVAQWIAVGGNPTYPLDKDACKDGGWKDPSYQPAFKNQGACVSYANHHKNAEQVLSLQKNASTATNSAGGATVEGVSGLTLTELGFDYNGYCGAGAPRFNVYTTNGTYYFFGCTYGTHTSLGNGYTRVRFSNADAFPADGVTAFPGFGTAVMTSIEIVQDEGPAQVLLDNIDVNGMLVGDM